MAVRIAVALTNSICDLIVDSLDAGAGAAIAHVATGAPPATCEAGNSGTTLIDLPLADPAFGNSGAVNPGEAIAAAITPAQATGNGDAGHVRLQDSNGNTKIQGTAGEAADNPDFVFVEKTIVAGGEISCSSLKVTVSSVGS